MEVNSLFGHLAARFSTHPENLATEALNYVLNRSVTARDALLRYVGQANVTLPPTLSFRTQVTGDDNAIPDLVGLDQIGNQTLLIEAKFWAGLTENQPVTYLQRLPGQRDAMLLFLVPGKRFPTLWNELIQRCHEAGISVGEQQNVSSEFITAQLPGRHVLALLSWHSLLAFLLRTVEAEGNLEVASDIMQLQGLCDRMDDQAFLPLRSEDLTSDIGTKVHQFCLLADDVTTLAIAERLVSVKGLRAAGGQGWYGRYMTIHGHGCLLHFSAYKWSRFRATPMWLRVKDWDWEVTPGLKAALSSLELEEPSRLFVLEEGLVIPIRLPTNVEKAHVVDAVLVQLREIAALLAAYQPPS